MRFGLGLEGFQQSKTIFQSKAESPRIMSYLNTYQLAITYEVDPT